VVAHFGGTASTNEGPRRDEPNTATTLAPASAPLLRTAAWTWVAERPRSPHADVYVERAGSDLTGEHGRTGTQELSWVADFQAGRPQRQRCHYPALRDCDKVPAMIQLAVIAAAPPRFRLPHLPRSSHGTELARYGSPWTSEIGITPQRGICTNPPTPNLWLCQCQVASTDLPRPGALQLGETRRATRWLLSGDSTMPSLANTLLT